MCKYGGNFWVLLQHMAGHSVIFCSILQVSGRFIYLSHKLCKLSFSFWKKTRFSTFSYSHKSILRTYFLLQLTDLCLDFTMLKESIYLFSFHIKHFFMQCLVLSECQPLFFGDTHLIQTESRHSGARWSLVSSPKAAGVKRLAQRHFSGANERFLNAGYFHPLMSCLSCRPRTLNRQPFGQWWPESLHFFKLSKLKKYWI